MPWPSKGSQAPCLGERDPLRRPFRLQGLWSEYPKEVRPEEDRHTAEIVPSTLRDPAARYQKSGRRKGGRLNIETIDGLIQNEEFGLMQHGQYRAKPLLHSSGIVLGIVINIFGKPQSSNEWFEERTQRFEIPSKLIVWHSLRHNLSTS